MNDWKTDWGALQLRALNEIREAYEVAAQMQTINVTRLNRSRPPSMRYRSAREVIREFLARADAVSTFATNLGLATPQETTAILREFGASHRDIGETEQDRKWNEKAFGKRSATGRQAPDDK